MKIPWNFVRKVGYWNYFSRNLVRQFHKRVRKADFWFTLPTGGRYLVPNWDPSGAEVYVTAGRIDNGLEHIFFHLLPENATLIDAGAHTGFYGALCAPKLKRYVALEPAPRNAVYIRAVVPSAASLTLFEGFADRKCGELRGRRHDASGWVWVDENGEDTFPVTTIDTFLDGQSADGIKIDVDGPDFEVLQGATATVEVFRPVIIIERLPDSDLMAFANQHAYRLFGTFTNESGVWEVREVTSVTPDYAGKMTLLLPRERIDEIEPACRKSGFHGIAF